jgi:hypothetical protein
MSQDLVEVLDKFGHTAYPLQKERADPKPWILPWLEEACARKQNLYHLKVTNPSGKNSATYDKMNKFCKKHKIIAEQRYYKSSLKSTRIAKKNSGNLNQQPAK